MRMNNVFYKSDDFLCRVQSIHCCLRNVGDLIAQNIFPDIVWFHSGNFSSIYDNIAYGPRTHGIHNKAKLDEIVERSLRDAAIWNEVKDRLKKNALGLSGGQQQRLCIARALAVEPKVLLMDEPTSALDPIATNRIEELLLELKKEFTIIIVTHNMSQAARISDYSMFMYLGELIEYDKTRIMFTNPRDKRTEEYLTGQFG